MRVTARPAAPVADPRVLAEAQALLTAEVHLLDDRAYEEWLRLFAPECLYWMPVDPDCTDGAGRLNVVYDDRARMTDRVARLTSGTAFSEEPPTRTARVLSGVQVDGGTGAPGDPLVVRSTFCLTAHRAGQQRHLAGRCTHRLVHVDGELVIAEKRVALLGSDAPQRPMTFLF